MGWKPITWDGVELLSIASVSITRYRWRGTQIPTPWPIEIIEPVA
jgi:RNA-directed DNA polymerase